MRVFVTGATGFLGSHLVDQLCQEGHQVTCAIRENSNTKWLPDAITTVNLDLHGEITMLSKAIENHDVVFHIAGVVDAFNLDTYMKINVNMTENLIKACIACTTKPKRFIFISSLAALGPNNQRVHDNQKPNPITDYGRSKKAAEEVIQQYKNQLPIVSVRPTAIYGPRDKATFGIFKGANLGILPSLGGSKQVVNLCHVSDIVQGILQAAVADVPSGSAYLLADDREYSMKEIAQLFSSFLNKKVIVIPLPSLIIWIAASLSEVFSKMLRKNSIFNRQKVPELLLSWRIDSQPAREELGFQTSDTLASGLEKTFQWYKSNHWL